MGQSVPSCLNTVNGKSLPIDLHTQYRANLNSTTHQALVNRVRGLAIQLCSQFQEGSHLDGKQLELNYQLQDTARQLRGLERELTRCTALNDQLGELNDVIAQCDAQLATTEQQLHALTVNIEQKSAQIGALRSQKESLGQRIENLTQLKKQLAEPPPLECPLKSNHLKLLAKLDALHAAAKRQNLTPVVQLCRMAAGWLAAKPNERAEQVLGKLVSELQRQASENALELQENGHQLNQRVPVERALILTTMAVSASALAYCLIQQDTTSALLCGVVTGLLIAAWAQRQTHHLQLQRNHQRLDGQQSVFKLIDQNLLNEVQSLLHICRTHTQALKAISTAGQAPKVGNLLAALKDSLSIAGHRQLEHYQAQLRHTLQGAGFDSLDQVEAQQSAFALQQSDLSNRIRVLGEQIECAESHRFDLKSDREYEQLKRFRQTQDQTRVQIKVTWLVCVKPWDQTMRRWTPYKQKWLTFTQNNVPWTVKGKRGLPNAS